MYKRPTPRKKYHEREHVVCDVYLMRTVHHPPVVKRIRPIDDLEGYLRSLKWHGASDEELDMARRRNTPGDPMNLQIIPIDSTIEFDTSYTEDAPFKKHKKLPVSKVDSILFEYRVGLGHVYVNISVPFESAISYIKAGKSVPRDVQKLCLAKCRVENPLSVKAQVQLLLSKPMFKAAIKKSHCF